MLWVKVLVLVLLAASVVALFRALSAMMRGEGGEGKTVKALAWRIGLSVAIFLFLLLSMYMGWVKPHGVNPNSATVNSVSDESSSAGPRSTEAADSEVQGESRSGTSRVREQAVEQTMEAGARKE